MHSQWYQQKNQSSTLPLWSRPNCTARLTRLSEISSYSWPGLISKKTFLNSILKILNSTYQKWTRPTFFLSKFGQKEKRVTGAKTLLSTWWTRSQKALMWKPRSKLEIKSAPSLTPMATWEGLGSPHSWPALSFSPTGMSISQMATSTSNASSSSSTPVRSLPRMLNSWVRKRMICADQWNSFLKKRPWLILT